MNSVKSYRHRPWECFASKTLPEAMQARSKAQTEAINSCGLPGWPLMHGLNAIFLDVGLNLT